MRMTLLMTVGALTIMPTVAKAQVSGAIIVSGLPIGGVIQFGGPPPGAYYRARPRVAMYGYVPRVIVVERWRGNRHREEFRRMRSRQIWYDRYDDRYFDGYRPGLVEVQVYERDGRYYRPYDDDRDERYDRRRGHHGKPDRDDWSDRDRP